MDVVNDDIGNMAETNARHHLPVEDWDRQLRKRSVSYATIGTGSSEGHL